MIQSQTSGLVPITDNSAAMVCSLILEISQSRCHLMLESFKGPQHKCCSVILLVDNLPPSIRYHKWNTLLSMIIPRPKEHGDSSSFLLALMEELHQLHEGVDA
jgi:hypothetical protein